jgi:hypothetical protein
MMLNGLKLSRFLPRTKVIAKVLSNRVAKRLKAVFGFHLLIKIHEIKIGL